MASGFLFFLYYPYHDRFSNCPEIVLSKLTTITEMFAELHQVYFIGFILGIGNFNILFSRHFSFSLVQLLKASFAVMVTAIVVSYYFFRGSLTFVEDICTVFVSLAQVYVIRVAESAREDHIENSMVSVRDTSIAVFKTLSLIQLFLSSVSLTFRFATATAMLRGSGPMLRAKPAALPNWSDSLHNAASVVMAIDYFCTYLFYIKVILVREKSKNVSVEIVQGE